MSDLVAAAVGSVAEAEDELGHFFLTVVVLARVARGEEPRWLADIARVQVVEAALDFSLKRLEPAKIFARFRPAFSCRPHAF